MIEKETKTGDTDTVGELSPEQHAGLIALLAATFGNYSCEICKHDQWILNRRIVSPQLLSITKSGFAENNTLIHPSLHIVCKCCGNTKLVSTSVVDFDLFADE